MQVTLSPQPPGDCQRELPQDLQDKVDGMKGKLADVRARLEASKQEALATKKIVEEGKRPSSKRSFPN